MTSIQMTVTGAAAVARKQGLLTAGMTGIPVTFSFSQEWENLTIIPVFRCGEITRDNTLEDMRSTVPHEVMQPGLLYIGAEGRSADGTVVIPTVWALVGQVLEGANATENPALAPTPSQYDRLNARITTLENGGIPEAQLPEIFVVTVTGNDTDGYTADRTIAQIHEAYQAKKTLLCKVTDDGLTILLHPICITNALAWFFASSGDITCVVKMTREEIRVENHTHANANDIPTALPNPYGLTIGGKTYNGSVPVEVTLPDGEKEWKLLADITTEEDVAIITVDLPENCTELFMKAHGFYIAGGSGFSGMKINNTSLNNLGAVAECDKWFYNNNERYAYCHLTRVRELLVSRFNNATLNPTPYARAANQSAAIGVWENFGTDTKWETVSIAAYTSQFLSGFHFVVYGR